MIRLSIRFRKRSLIHLISQESFSFLARIFDPFLFVGNHIVYYILFYIYSYESTTLVILQISPLFVIIIASSEASIGTLRNLRHPLKPIIAEIANATGLY